MTKFAPLAALVTLAIFSLVPVTAHAQAAAPLKIAEGKMIYAVNGQPLAPVYRINTDGSVQLIMAGRLLTIPTGILSDVNGKLISSWNEGELQR